MKEFIEKLIGRLEEAGNYHLKLSEENKMDVRESHRHKSFAGIYGKAISIIKELAEEHNGGWIPCSERLPQENEPVDTVCEVVNVMMKSGTVTSGWCNRYLERWYVLDEYCDYPLQQNYEDVIAWQPLPEPYQAPEEKMK